MQKENRIQRAAVIALATVMLMATPALALFGKKTQEEGVPATGAPIARELEIRTYRNIPYHAQFLSSDSEGDDVTYAVETEPKHGTVTVNGADFVYTPAENKTGTDSFTYVATDSGGNVSAPANVSVTISKVKSGVNYADTGDSSAAAAAQQLAETGVFTGEKIGSEYFFEPERTVSRSEFLVMTMQAAGMDADAVTMTGFCDDEAIPTWAKSYAAAGLTEGVIQGTHTAEGIAFRSDDPITYNEAASILNRVLSVNDVDLATWYADRTAVPSWAAQAVGNMESVNVMAAGSFGSSTLDNSMTRADAAQMLCAAQTLMTGEQTGIFDWLS